MAAVRTNEVVGADSCVVALVTSQVERKLSSVEQWSLVRVREVVSVVTVRTSTPSHQPVKVRSISDCAVQSSELPEECEGLSGWRGEEMCRDLRCFRV